jgi:hypothetical protein
MGVTVFCKSHIMADRYIIGLCLQTHTEQTSTHGSAVKFYLVQQNYIY